MNCSGVYNDCCTIVFVSSNFGSSANLGIGLICTNQWKQTAFFSCSCLQDKFYILPVDWYKP